MNQADAKCYGGLEPEHCDIRKAPRNTTSHWVQPIYIYCTRRLLDGFDAAFIRADNGSSQG